MPLTDRFRGLFSNLGLIAPKKASPFQNVGTTGTAILGGFVQERDRNRELIGTKKYETFANIVANVSIVAAGISIYLSFVGKSKWKIVSKDDTNEQFNKNAEFIQQCIDGMETPWSRVVRRLAMYRMYGFCIHEWTAKKNKDGSIGLLDIESRPQFTIEQWDVDENGNLLGVIQRSPLTFNVAYIPKSKMIYLVEDSLTDDPRGLGALRQIAMTAHTLDLFTKLEQIGYETDMRGIPLLRAPLETLRQKLKDGTLTQEEFNKIINDLKDIIKNHIRSTDSGVLLSSEQFQGIGENTTNFGANKYDFSLLSGDNYGHAEIGEAINRKQKEIARVLGVEQLLLGESSTGSLALARDKSKTFADIINAVLLEIKQAIDKDIIQPLCMLNGFPDDSYPVASFERVEQRDIEQISQVLSDMSSAGIMLTVDDEPIGQIFDLLGLERPDPLIDRNFKRQESLKERDLETGKPDDDVNTDDTEESKNLKKPNGKVQQPKRSN